MAMLFQIAGAHRVVPTVALGERILGGSLVDLLLFALMQVPSNVRHGVPALPQFG